jgi:hypothetical protein
VVFDEPVPEDIHEKKPKKVEIIKDDDPDKEVKMIE